MNFYSERPAIPYKEIHNVVDGQIEGPAEKTKPDNGNLVFIRHMSHGVLLTHENAVTIRDWLDAHIGNLKEREQGNAVEDE